MEIIEKSHLDHGLTEAHVEFISEQFEGRDGFFIGTITIPERLGPLDCKLYGPKMRDNPIPEKAVFYETRGDRSGESRLVDREPRETRRLTVIAGPHGDHDCVLFTAFGGPQTPKEPWDEMEDEAEQAESEEFWAEHALSASAQ